MGGRRAGRVLGGAGSVSGWPGRGVICCLIALAALAWPKSGWGHSRTRHLPPPLPAAAGPALSLSAPAREAAPAPTSWQDLFREANVRGMKGEGAALLLRAARGARQRGEVAHARWLYGLLLRVQPESEAAASARRERLVLDFYQELAEMPPLAACRRFFPQLLGQPEAGRSPEVRQAVREGWRALEQLGLREGPLPPAAAEQLLDLWDLTPPECRPPEARLLLARLFQERGLGAEARQFLEQVAASAEEPLRLEAMARLLELAWAEQGLGGFLAALAQLASTPPAAVAALRAWPLHLEGSPAVEMAPSPGEMTLAPALRLRLWEALNGQALPGPLTLHLLQDLAKMHQAGETQATALYHAVLEGARDRLDPGYYYDRVGLEHLRQRQWLAAQEAFQAQMQDEDPLWQQLGRVRLLEVELAQIQAGGPR